MVESFLCLQFLMCPSFNDFAFCWKDEDQFPASWIVLSLLGDSNRCTPSSHFFQGLL